jgi:hypothetical protein
MGTFASRKEMSAYKAAKMAEVMATWPDAYSIHLPPMQGRLATWVIFGEDLELEGETQASLGHGCTEWEAWDMAAYEVRKLLPA